MLLVLAQAAAAAPPSTCDLEGDYEKALCAYQTRDFPAAERGFRSIVDAGGNDERMIHSLYFLARTMMKTGGFDEASTLFIRIYALDPAFYQVWSCDFLLGECRKAMGQ